MPTHQQDKVADARCGPFCGLTLPRGLIGCRCRIRGRQTDDPNLHGGLKQSGYGKDMSVYALEDYSVVRHVMAKLG